MKKSICVTLIVLGSLVLAFAPTPTTAAVEGGTITCAAQGIFPAGTALGPVLLDSLQLASGVIVEPDSSALGALHVVLVGHSALGQLQEITVDGKVSQGTVDQNGLTSFSGLASIDSGNGAPLQSSVPFSLTGSESSLTLTIGSTTLPPASMTGGSVVIE